MMGVGCMPPGTALQEQTRRLEAICCCAGFLLWHVSNKMHTLQNIAIRKTTSQDRHV